MSILPEDKVVRGADLATIGILIDAKLDSKQEALVSGTNIKTINGTSILGAGDITIVGEKGAQGPQGIRGEKGEQGNPGSSQEYPFELENSLNGGTTKALTAEMGKSLAGTINGYDEVLSSSEVDLSECTTAGRFFNTVKNATQWIASGSASSTIVPLADYRDDYDYIRLVSGDNGPSGYTFTTEAMPDENVTAVSGYLSVYMGTSVRKSVSANSYRDIPLAEVYDAAYMYLCKRTGSETSSVNHLPDVYFITKAEHMSVIDEKINDTGYWEPVKVSSGYNAYIRFSNASSKPNTWYITTAAKHIYIAATPGEVFRVTATASAMAGITFLTKAPSVTELNNDYVNKPADWATGYDSVIAIPPGVSKEFVTPNDATHMYVFVGSTADAATPASIERKKTYSEVMAQSQADIKDIRSILAGGTGILDFNPDSEVEPKLLAMRKGSGSTPNNFIFGHVSDCHGSGTISSQSNVGWSRILTFFNHWKEKGFISDIVDTGDIMGQQYSGSIAWRAGEGNENILITIGNHDTSYYGQKSGESSPSHHWRDNVGAPAYTKFIAPYVENWNVNQPEDAATNGYCYYYKDYTNDTKAIRAIFVDVMGWDEENVQGAWVAARLAEARVLAKDVVIFCHFPPVEYRKLDCSYTSESASYIVNSIDTYNPWVYNLAKIVRDYQEEGGTFIGYVCGHRHLDAVGIVCGTREFDGQTIDFDSELYPQMVYCIGNGAVGLEANSTTDFYRVSGIKSMDNFQIVGINPSIVSGNSVSGGYVKLMKIGCTIDIHMKKKDILEVYYRPIAEYDPSVTYSANAIVSKDGCLYRLKKQGMTWDSSIKKPFSRIISEATDS